MAENYLFRIIQCDVPQERRAALEAYRAKRREWLAWLDTDEHHAIWTTISGMVWTDVSFRTLAQFAAEDETSCLSNTLVAEQIISGHVATQVLAIRRLVDNRRDVISLRRLIKDMRSNFSLSPGKITSATTDSLMTMKRSCRGRWPRESEKAPFGAPQRVQTRMEHRKWPMSSSISLREST
ncbi:hypothetical protein ABIB82_006472 [Bradyrhizobium sp. i1.8.4]